MRVATAETALLLAAAGDHPELPARAAAIRDWPLTLRLAATHRLGPLLHQRLAARAPGAAPPETLAALAGQTRTAAVRAVHMRDALHRLLARFEAAGIPALPMRGPALADQVYTEPDRRLADDLDLLLDRADLYRARDLLAAEGWTPRQVVPPAAEAAHIAAGGALMLRHPRLALEADLAWTPAPRYFCSPWTRGEMTGGAAARALPPERLLLLLCLHGGKHLWARHAWTADVAALMRRPLDWDRALAEARARGMVRLLLVGVVWAAEAGGRRLDAAVGAAVRRDAEVGAVADRLRAAFAADPAWAPADDWPRLRLLLSLRERRRDRARGLLVRLLAPSPNDWRALSLPRPLRPLYALTRPVRLGWRHLRGGGAAPPAPPAPGPPASG